MKNQYFGDINDFRKYGLLRSLLRAGNVKLLVAWMLTGADDKKPGDGKFTGYLNEANKHSACDPELHRWLRRRVYEENARSVSLIEDSDLLDATTFYSEGVPDDRDGRHRWAEGLYGAAKDANLVFLDPDNGIEIPSKPYGRKHSSKYVYWGELERLWKDGKSLLIYQHFTRAKRDGFIRTKLGDLNDHLRDPQPCQVSAYITPHVVFFLALQKQICFEVNDVWKERGKLWRWKIER